MEIAGLIVNSLLIFCIVAFIYQYRKTKRDIKKIEDSLTLMFMENNKKTKDVYVAALKIIELYYSEMQMYEEANEVKKAIDTLKKQQT